ncbi:hypothetical protein RI129_009719 [Pyrocoelia pectoralis]|uniref:Methyltransferase type 11 domain-containing protein n=1 Tax=Pyrocoelia pectoralis TaxID=417401 RepID=A0AAN7V590_9COLE
MSNIVVYNNKDMVSNSRTVSSGKMSKPATFLRFNFNAREQFRYLARNYFKVLNLKEDSYVLDVGCGPGDITKYGLLPKLPKTTKKLVGIDISSDMINFAKMYHQDDKRLTYQVLDITTNELPNNFRETFDHVFSFYCLHFASDLRKAIENIHLMLKSNGEIFFSILLRAPVLDYYERVVKKDDWCQYMNYFKSRLGPFQHSTTSKELMESILKETGFKVNLCKEERKLFIDSKENFMGLMDSMNYLNIPKHLEEKFSLSQWEAVKEAGRDFIDEYGEEYTYYPYTLLIVHAKKY